MNKYTCYCIISNIFFLWQPLFSESSDSYSEFQLKLLENREKSFQISFPSKVSLNSKKKNYESFDHYVWKAELNDASRISNYNYKYIKYLSEIGKEKAALNLLDTYFFSKINSDNEKKENITNNIHLFFDLLNKNPNRNLTFENYFKWIKYKDIRSFIEAEVFLYNFKFKQKKTATLEPLYILKNLEDHFQKTKLRKLLRIEIAKEIYSDNNKLFSLCESMTSKKIKYNCTMEILASGFLGRKDKIINLALSDLKKFSYIEPEDFYSVVYWLTFLNKEHRADEFIGNHESKIYHKEKPSHYLLLKSYIQLKIKKINDFDSIYQKLLSTYAKKKEELNRQIKYIDSYDDLRGFLGIYRNSFYQEIGENSKLLEISKSIKKIDSLESLLNLHTEDFRKELDLFSKNEIDEKSDYYFREFLIFKDYIGKIVHFINQMALEESRFYGSQISKIDVSRIEIYSKLLVELKSIMYYYEITNRKMLDPNRFVKAKRKYFHLNQSINKINENWAFINIMSQKNGNSIPIKKLSSIAAIKQKLNSIKFDAELVKAKYRFYRILNRKNRWQPSLKDSIERAAFIAAKIELVFKKYRENLKPSLQYKNTYFDNIWNKSSALINSLYNTLVNKQSDGIRRQIAISNRFEANLKKMTQLKKEINLTKNSLYSHFKDNRKGLLENINQSLNKNSERISKWNADNIATKYLKNINNQKNLVNSIEEKLELLKENIKTVNMAILMGWKEIEP